MLNFSNTEAMKLSDTALANCNIPDSCHGLVLKAYPIPTSGSHLSIAHQIWTGPLRNCFICIHWIPSGAVHLLHLPNKLLEKLTNVLILALILAWGRKTSLHSSRDQNCQPSPALWDSYGFSVHLGASTTFQIS